MKMSCPPLPHPLSCVPPPLPPHRTCQIQHWMQHKPNCKFVPELIGQPFMLSLPESKATYAQICSVLEMRAR